MEYKFAPLEVEAKADGSIDGYASKFGIKDQGGDIVVKGAYQDTLGVRKPKMLWQHDPSKPIGIWSEAKEDGDGLRVSGQINLDVRQGAEAYSLLKMGAIDGMSIGYRTREAQNTKAGRELLKLDLFEVSLVTFPMQVEATVDSVKGITDPVSLKRFVERLLRDADLSISEAKAAAAAVAKVREGREAPADRSVMLEELIRTIRGL